MDFIETISRSLDKDVWLPPLERARFIVVIVNFFLIAFWTAVFLKSLRYRPNVNPFRRTGAKTLTLENQVLREAWLGVMKRFAAGSADSLKLAVIEADKLADETLRSLGLEGEHMADRLEKISSEELRTLDRLWRAHRMRNELVHTPGYELTVDDAKRVLGDYRAFLEEVGLLSFEETPRR